jgi:hypothetical protein
MHAANEGAAAVAGQPRVVGAGLVCGLAARDAIGVTGGRSGGGYRAGSYSGVASPQGGHSSHGDSQGHNLKGGGGQTKLEATAGAVAVAGAERKVAIAAIKSAMSN